ncbi:hypothetical protein AB0L05_29920 [Nonomuraea pusilla]|uniref:hypothetical protein n=1 Tax=Nonomuraea pusilla TaxID=46177 RepID=UPI003316B653
MTQQMTAPGRVAAVSAGAGAGVGAGVGAVWANLAFTAGVVIIWAWFSAVSPHLYRRVPSQH